MVNYPSGLALDSAVVERTRLFFDRVKEETASDEELLALVQQGICLEARGFDDQTPLMWPVKKNYIETVRALLAAGADIEARNKDAWTALHYASCYAIHYNHREIIETLLAAGANIEVMDNGGWTPLYIAARVNNDIATKLLMNKGANLYVRDGRGHDTMHNTVFRDDESFVGDINAWEGQYEHFINSRQAPDSAAQVYHFLAVTPLADPYAPVDYAGNLRRIFSHAKWENKAQAEAILQEIHKDGMINAATCESILAATFPPERARRSQPGSVGMAI